MQSAKESGDPVPAADADARVLLEFVDRERRRAQRATLLSGAIGVLIGALVVSGASVCGWIRLPSPTTDDARDGVDRRIAELEGSAATLTAQLRALVSQPRSAPLAGDADIVSNGSRKESSDAAIAGKPSGTALDERERANRVGDTALARALERARQIPDPVPTVRDPVPTVTAPPAAPPKVEEAPATPPDPTLAAFNALLVDCGFDRWRLLSAEPAPEDHALRHVVLIHRTPNGTATGSLTADHLTLERDAASGVAAFVLTGARQIEAGVEEAFPNGMTRLDIPGVLPLQMVPAELATLFGTAPTGAIGKNARFDPKDAAQVTRAINHVLEQEKTVALRVRSCEKFVDEKLEKAVIDLLYDDHGAPRQTVYADRAWFEIDSKHGSAELCCEGGEMTVDGSRRPLFRGRLRWPIYSVTAAQWVGMPALKGIGGS